jgi:hypothetical protein
MIFHLRIQTLEMRKTALHRAYDENVTPLSQELHLSNPMQK